MISTTLLTLALAGLTTAQQSSVTLVIPGTDPMPLVGSIIASDASATTYAISCAPGGDSINCGFFDVLTLTEGPKTVAYTTTIDTIPDESATESSSLYLSASIGCSLDGTVSAVCTISAKGDGFTEASQQKQTSTISGTDMGIQTVTLTTSPIGTAAPATTSKLPSSTPTGSSTFTSLSSTGSGTGAAPAQQTSSSTSSSQAGVAMVTANPKVWIAGGAALAAALL